VTRPHANAAVRYRGAGFRLHGPDTCPSGQLVRPPRLRRWDWSRRPARRL